MEAVWRGILVVVLACGCGRFGFGGRCTIDAECLDDSACNGLELCSPTNPSADDRGCVAGTPVTCDIGRACNETTSTCSTDCAASADADGDATLARECGGDDCDDGDAEVFVGANETCNARDDDCDERTDESPATCVATLLTAGPHFACTVLSTGAVACWGENEYGQLGDGRFDHDSRCGAPPKDCSRIPVGVTLPGPAAGVTAGSNFACALVDALVYCWGQDTVGELGDGMPGGARATPSEVVGLGPVLAIEAGDHHTCAITVGGDVRCWGAGDNGQLGDNTTTNHAQPIPAQLQTTPALVALGGSTSCAATSAEIWCWGKNDNGQVGDGTSGTDRQLPVSTFVAGATAMGVGNAHACSVTAGNVSCWGDDEKDQLGNGVSPGPVVSMIANGATAVAGGEYHSCAIDAAGSAWCWGDGEAGNLGDGAGVDSRVPTQVTGVASVSAIATGNNFTCLIDSGSVLCFGSNEMGALGDGTKDGKRTPNPVSGL